jgi:nucleoid-associated protein YgaU
LVKSNVDLDGNLIQQKKNLEAALRKKNKRNNWLLFFLFLIPLLSYFYFNRTPDIIEKKVVVNNDSLSIYKEQLLRTQTKNMELSRQIKAIEGTRKVRQLKYVIKEGDILNDLGKLFYNDSLAWYQIAIDNHIYDVRGLPIGDTLIMNYRE